MIKAASIVILLLLLTVPVGIWWCVQRPVPPLDAVIHAPAIAEPVLVRFDGRAIGYIEARQDADLYMAQGYVTARDRMFQMDMLRRVAEGKLSQVFGPALLAQDKLVRTVGYARAAQRELASLPEPARAALQAYCRGVNFYLRSAGDRLPLEFGLIGYSPAPWQPLDTLAVMKYLEYLESESWKLDELRQRVQDRAGDQVLNRLFADGWSSPPVVGASPGPLPATGCRKRWRLPDLSPHLIAALDSLGAIRLSAAANPCRGSNACVLDGRRSTSGGCLLAGDKHDAFWQPDIWYLVSLKSPAVHVAGATIPGVPGVLVGRNDNIAWTSASLRADVQDLFIEEFSEHFPKQYRTVSGWEDATEVTEAIPVRFAKDLLHKVLITRHGPVLVRSERTGVALSWTGNQSERSSLASYLRLNRAASWADFTSALAEHPGPPLAFIYADRFGNIGLQAAGDVPVRAGDGQGTTVSRGWQATGQWSAKLGFADLPSALAPAPGFIVACNQNLVGPGFRHLLGHQWACPFRAARATALLSAASAGGRHFGLPDMNDLQADQTAYLSDLVKREIRESIVRTELIDRIQLTAMDVLNHWPGDLSVNSPAASIYESFLRTLTRRLVESKIGPDLTRDYLSQWPMWPLFAEGCLRAKSADWLPPEERTYPTFILTTFSQALKNLRLSTKSDDARGWDWGSVHRATFKHVITRGLPWLSPLFDIAAVPVGGDKDTLNACDTALIDQGGKFPSEAGPCLRMLVDMADNEKLYLSTCLGQSGHLFSPFRKDQLKPWLSADPMPVAWSDTQLNRQSQHRLVLTGAPP